LNDKPASGTTPSQTVGPYFHLGLCDPWSVSCLAGPDVKGERVRLTCRVLDGNGYPVDDSMIEIWQADAQGEYAKPTSTSSCPGFGRMGVAPDGTCTFETIKPGRVPGPGNSLQAAHLNVMVFARGLLRHLNTRIYFAGDAALEADPVLMLVPEDRRYTLLAQPDLSREGAWRFDIHLRGEHETVFFDV